MGELVEFEGRNRVLGLRELENKLLLCPTDEQFRRVRHAHTTAGRPPRSMRAMRAVWGCMLSLSMQQSLKHADIQSHAAGVHVQTRCMQH